MVGPLYGGEPKYGIRELVQNSIDAVRERRELIGTESTLDSQLDVDVTIESHDDTHWLTVRDTGIGMTADVIVNYFLKAGASYRSSEGWKKSFENAEGHSKVLRSGRFGVGALAAFLFGDEFSVVTRHANASPDDGITFVASLDSDVLELQRIPAEIGTTIRIRLKESVFKTLTQKPSHAPLAFVTRDWDFYCLDDIRVARAVQSETLSQRFSLPGRSEPLPSGWRAIRPKDFEIVHWTYKRSAPRLTCNGILISDYYANTEFIEGQKFQFGLPALSVFDPDGNLPLDLKRTQLATRDVPFGNELLESVCDDVISWLSLTAPKEALKNDSLVSWLHNSKYPDLQRPGGVVSCSPLAATAEGLWFSFLLGSGGVSRIEFLARDSPFIKDAVIEPATAVMAMHFGGGVTGMAGLVRFMLAAKRVEWEADDLDEVVEVHGARLVIPAQAFDSLGKRYVPNYFRKTFEVERLGNGWLALRKGDIRPGMDIRGMTARVPRSLRSVAAEWFVTSKKPSGRFERLDALWKDRVGSAALPYRSHHNIVRMAAIENRLSSSIERHCVEHKERSLAPLTLAFPSAQPTQKRL
jgi:hypothetical protein